MNDSEIPRLTRLAAIQTLLQSKRILTATEMAEKFGISIRTVYRDIRALEQAGVPVYTVDGKGYSIMEGYVLPPVMFNEEEANALITAEKMIRQNRDASFAENYTSAVTKIKSVLRSSTKQKSELLADRIIYRYNNEDVKTSNYLSDIQVCLTNNRLIRIHYADEGGTLSERSVEPFALYSTQDNWILVAWCRLRSDFRSFRLDRISKLIRLDELFEPHNYTLIQFFEACRRNEKESENGL